MDTCDGDIRTSVVLDSSTLKGCFRNGKVNSVEKVVMDIDSVSPHLHWSHRYFQTGLLHNIFRYGQVGIGWSLKKNFASCAHIEMSEG